MPCAASIIVDAKLQTRTTRHGAAAKARIATEILQKLRLAARTLHKDEAQRQYEHVFMDLIGTVEERAQEVLGTGQSCAFFEILADYYTHNWKEAEDVLDVCRVMWGQSYVAAIFTLLLHKWLLGNPDAGGELHRHKHLNVLLTGCRQLIWADIQSCTTYVRPLFNFIHQSYTDAAENHPFRNAFLPLIGQFLPYYCPKQMLESVIAELPFEHNMGREGGAWMPFGNVGFTPDLLFLKFTEMIKQLAADEPGLESYLESLSALRTSPLLLELKTVTHLQFQAQLYSLTAQGGPRYPSPNIRRAAFATLDVLYPAGSRTRKLISQLFKIFHPLDWARRTLTIVGQSWSRSMSVILFLFSWILFCVRCLMKPFIR